MKRILTTFALTLILSVGAFAQDFHLGFKLGANANWTPGTTVTGYEKVTPHVGYYAGLFVNYFFSEVIFIQPEILYSCKGFASRADITSDKYRENMRYLQIPLLFGVELFDGKWDIMIGPEFGSCLSAEVKYGGYTLNVKSAANPFNLAAVLQSVYYVTDNLGVDIKIDYGITRTWKKAPTELTSFQDKAHNVSLQIGFSYTFGR